VRVVLADRNWKVVDERRIKAGPARSEEIDMTLSASRESAVHLRLDDEEVTVQPSDLRLTNIVVIEENP
jgi:hypothetical protein